MSLFLLERILFGNVFRKILSNLRRYFCQLWLGPLAEPVSACLSVCLHVTIPEPLNAITRNFILVGFTKIFWPMPFLFNSGLQKRITKAGVCAIYFFPRVYRKLKIIKLCLHLVPQLLDLFRLISPPIHFGCYIKKNVGNSYRRMTRPLHSNDLKNSGAPCNEHSVRDIGPISEERRIMISINRNRCRKSVSCMQERFLNEV
jgi:hypothetical protein